MKVGTVLKNDKWRVKIYSPPREHGPHVHVISRRDQAEVKIFLKDLSLVGKTRFSRKAVKEIIKYLHQNYDFLMDQWEALHGKKKKT